MLEEGEATFYALRPMPIQRCCKFLTSTCFRNLRFLVISLCVQHKNITLASKTLYPDGVTAQAWRLGWDTNFVEMLFRVQIIVQHAFVLLAQCTVRVP